MYSKLTAEWRALRRGRPGHRFQDRYVAARRARTKASFIARIVRLVVAIAALGVGLVLVVMPGPAILFFLISGSFLAAESRVVARWLDRIELRTRSLATWGRRQWFGFCLASKVTLVAFAAAVCGAALFAMYRLWFA